MTRNFPPFRVRHKSFYVYAREFWRELQPRIVPIHLLKFTKVSLRLSNNPLRNRNRNHLIIHCSNID